MKTIISLMITLLFLTSCSENNTEGIEVTKSACKHFIFAEESDDDCIDYSWSNNMLTIQHINAGFNCCPEKISITTEVHGDTLIIRESELLTNPCDCNCLYDLNYQLNNILPGKYIIKVEEPYIKQSDTLIIFAVDFSKQPAGKHCVKRSSYPWVK